MTPLDTMVMLQELRRESLEAVMEHPWVRQNFHISDIQEPQSIYNDTGGDDFIMKDLKWRAMPYFTTVMVSRDIPVVNSFRVPFVTNMGRDGPVVDITVSD